LTEGNVPERYLKTLKREISASRGVVVTNHPLASAAGIEVMASGGNAFDATIASLFALTVVEPMMVSMFGAGYFVTRDGKTGDITTLDNYAVAPKAASESMYTPVEERKPDQYIFETVGRKNVVGHLSVATPGALKGWEHIQTRHGRLSLSEVIAPAIRLANDGYHATSYLAYFVDFARRDMTLYEETAKTFLPGGAPLRVGDLVKMPEYAETLNAVAKKGSDYLYRGELGRAVVDDIKDNGGVLDISDLTDYEVHEVPPVTGTYRDKYCVASMGSGSSGGTHIIQMLNILEHFDVKSHEFGSPRHIHLIAEALKIAFADRQRYMGDPWRIPVPVKGLASKAYAASRALEICDTAKTYIYGNPPSYGNEGQYTTHVSVMDDNGNVVAATQTLFTVFGSAVTVPGTGMLLNNCMGLFDPHPGRANSVSGGKRMLSSMAPTIVTRDNKPFLCIGSPGGTMIFPAICQALVNIVDYEMGIQQAVEAPRVWTMGISGTPEGRLHVEPELSDETITELTRMGHDILKVPKVAGGMNGILVDVEGLMHGGACWRADGTPMGISGGEAATKALRDRFTV
jgi:gamma-glutamyltranspeptidase/glutathione hydrolase